jgi:Histidine kinase-, DNA gyrase B-, and HSP90-like ATPase
MNLLSNSLKFTRHGYVMLSLETAPEGLVIKVKDSGIGIPKAFLPQLFEPFSQAETRGSQRGTGLGLSIVKQLLHQMGGSIAVESKFDEQGSPSPGETGSTFTITIPTQILPATPHTARELLEPGNIAIFHDGARQDLEGLVLAWEIFGHKVTVVRQFADLLSLEVKYVWVDSKYLDSHPECLEQLLNQDDWIVLVPYDDQENLKRLPGALLAQNFIPLQKPLVWHTFRSRIALAKGSSSSSALTPPFTSSVSQSRGHSSRSANLISNHVNILLVEDNKVSLGY